MLDNLPPLDLESIGARHGLGGLVHKGSVRGQRHEVIKLQDSRGQHLALRRFIPKEHDINYFNFDFSMQRECLAIDSLNKNGVRAPALLAQDHNDEIGHYALLSWLDGDHLNAHFKAACETGDYDAMTRMVQAIAHLFVSIHETPVPTGLRTSQDNPLKIYIDAIHAHVGRTDFQKIYSGDIYRLLDAANRLYEEAPDDLKPSLVIYDLHGENMIVNDDELSVFDVDYAHVGVTTAEFIPIFHDLIARFVPGDHALSTHLRQEVLSSYAALGGVFHADCERLLALNHFITSMIKLVYRKEAEAQGKIPTYDAAIADLVTDKPLVYPQVGWAGDPVFKSK